MSKCKDCRWAEVDPNETGLGDKVYHWFTKKWPEHVYVNLLCGHKGCLEMLKPGKWCKQRCWQVRDKISIGCTRRGVYFELKEGSHEEGD